MPTFLLLSRHSPENCPIYSTKTRKAYMDYINKIEGLMKKHGIKDLGSCTVFSEHLNVVICEAPSLDALNKLSMEPEVMAVGQWETTEIKLAMNTEESMKLMKQVVK